MTRDKIQSIVNWGLFILVLVFLLWEKTILMQGWDYLVNSPYWIIEKTHLGWALVVLWIMALLPWRWIWYVPFKIAYRWFIEDIVVVMFKQKVLEHVMIDIKTYVIMKYKSFNKWVGGIMAVIGSVTLIGPAFIYGFKAFVALLKKVFVNTIFSKLKLFVFKYIPLIFTYITSIFPFIGGIFEIIFQYVAMDAIIGLIEKIPKFGPWVVKLFRGIREAIDNAAARARDWISKRIGDRIEVWAISRANALRTRTMALKSVNEGEDFHSLQIRLKDEKEEKKKKKQEKRKTLAWKIQSYLGGLAIFAYIAWFMWVVYTVHKETIKAWVVACITWFGDVIQWIHDTFLWSLALVS